MGACGYCRRPAGGTLCRDCARRLVRDVTVLGRLIPELRALAERKARIGGREGAANHAVAALPISCGWMDVYDEARTLMLHVAALGEIRWMLAPAGAWKGAWRWILANHTKVTASPQAGGLLDGLERFLHRIDRATTPADGRVTVVDCPSCGQRLAVPAHLDSGRCPACHDLLDDLQGLVRSRLKDLHERTWQGSPAEAALWLTRHAGVRVTRKQITDWLRRGRLPHARALRRGVWVFNLAELVEVAQAPAAA